jgi:hypothetical protein
MNFLCQRGSQGAKVGQKHQVACILAGISTCSTPLDDFTASMISQNLQHQWNQDENLSVMRTGRWIGGAMMFGIAEAIVKDITHG